jgi:phosphate transport system substrate-binding protein
VLHTTNVRYAFAFGLGIILAAAPLRGADALTGAGATFPFPLYEKWFAAYQKKFPEVSIQYRAIGSGMGMDALSRNEVDFAASDYPLTGTRLAASGRPIRQIPSVVGALVPAYHLEGIVEDVRFSPETLSGIYLGRIRRWDDPAMKAINRGIHLPARDIVVIHRSEPSGSTFIWTSYLANVSEAWRGAAGAGDSVNWPVGVAAEHNEGVAKAITRTPDSIGYVEFIYAINHRLDYGAVRNSSGRFVQADLTSVQAAAAALGSNGSGDVLEPITNAAGPNAYPIASVTYFLVPDDGSGAAKRSILLDFLSWMLTTGQKQAGSLGYVSLPPRVAEKALRVVSELQSRR